MEFLEFYIRKWLKESADQKIIICLPKWALITKEKKNQKKKSLEPKPKTHTKNIFTEEEDRIIINLVNQYGYKWKKIGERLGTRCGKQVRERYLNNLAPGVKREKFTLNEELRLYKLQKEHGNRWSYFTEFFPGRTADGLKNRFNSSIRGKRAQYKLILAINHESKVSFYIN